MDREQSIQIAKDFDHKWEGLSAKNDSGSDKGWDYKSAANLPGDTTVYAYLDSKGIPTLGWGSTYYNDEDNTKVELGDTMTKDECDALYDWEIREKEAEVAKLVTANLTNNQYAALISIAYNTGSGSTEFKNFINNINNGASDSDIENQIKNLRIFGLTGLKNRRKDEAQLWSGNYNELYSMYLRNASAVNYTVLAITVIGLAVYGRYLYKHNILSNALGK